MYKIIVVDDELWFRQGIKGSIQWSMYDSEIVGEACDGEEALDVIERERPDIVFADVRMPVMDGLELASIIAKKYPDIRIIIVSGYEEFEYARKAMSLGVSYYLTKPVEANQLIEVVNKVKEEICQKREDKINREKIEEQLKESLPLLREKFLNTLVNGDIRSISEIKEKLDFLNIKMELSQYSVFVMDIEYIDGLFSSQDEKNRQMTRLLISNTLTEVIKEENIQIFNGFSENIVGIATYNASMDLMLINTRISKLFVKFKNLIQKHLKLPITIGISKVSSSWDKVNDAYREAIDAVKYKLFLGKDQVIFYQDITINKNDNYYYIFNGREDLVDALKLCDLNRTKSILIGNFEELVKKTYFEIDHIQQIYFPVLGDISNLLYDIGEPTEKVFDGNPFKKLMQLSTLEDINSWVNSICCRVIDAITDLRYQQNKKAVQKVTGYVYNNYNRDISLNSAAEYVFLSPAYLSRLFKKETGKSFIEFVMEVRVEKAKILLRNTDKKTYEIAKEVGYNDIRYFTKMFKSLEGITPIQYREKF